MTGWIVALLAAGIIGGLWRRSDRRVRRNVEQLEQALDDLGEGKAPRSLVFRGRAFAAMAARIERLVEQRAFSKEESARGESNAQTVLDSMEEGVMVVDEQHVLRQANPSFLKLFELTNDPRGQTVLSVLREAAIEEMVAAAIEGNARQAGEVTLSSVKPNRHFALTVVPTLDEDGRKGAVAIFRDISRLRQLEDVRREFVANVSHELRTPLSIFHGYVENLIDDPGMPAEAQREIFEVLRKHSVRLNALIEDLLTLARLESNQDAPKLEPLSLDTFLLGLTEDWVGRIGRKGVELEVEIPAGLPALAADPMRLEQVFHNLIENAAKYTGKGGRIAIRAASAGEAIEVRVEDTGVGIPPGDLPHIFERFYRADKARTRSQGGTGLGLAIVKHIVESHGGSVRAESTYGKGTAIIFRLPAAMDRT